MAETLTIELKDAVAAGPLPPPPAPPAYQLPAPAQAVPLPLRPAQAAEASRPAPQPALSAPLEAPRDVLSRLSAVLERLAASLAQAAPDAPGRAGAAVPAAPAAAAPARLPAPPLGPGASPAGAREELTPGAPKSKRLAWDEVEALFGVGAMAPPPANLPPPPAGFDFGPLPPAQTRPAQTGPVIVQAPDVTVEAPQVPAPPQPAAPRPGLVPHPDDSAERLEAKRRQAHSEREKAIRDEQERLKVLEVQPLSDWEKNTRPGLRVGPKDDPATADAKRRQQHAEYEQEVYRRRKELMPPVPAQPGAAMGQLGQIGQAAGLMGGAGGKAASAAGTGLGQLQAALAPGGAAAAGGLAGAAALAGPVGMVAAAAMELQHQVQEMGRSAVQGIGQTLTRTAALDPRILGDAVEKGTELGMKALSMVPGVGPVASLAGPAVVEAVRQVRAFGEAVDQTAARLAGYSAPLARAQAEAGVRSVQRDIGRADHLGEVLSKWVEAQSTLSEDIKDILADALKPLLELAAEVLREIATGVHQLRKDLHTWMPGIFRAVTDADKTKLLWEQIAQAGDFLALRPPDRFDPPPAAGRAGGPRLPLGAFP